MRNFLAFRLVSVVLCSLAIASCQSPSAIDGSGYQFVKFTDPTAARLSSQDPTAGPAIASNNKQCKKDEGCIK